MQEILTQAQAEASNARILVAIAFHYKESRVRYLADVVMGLSTFPVEQIDIAVMTNTTDPDEIAVVLAACPVTSDRVTLNLIPYVALADPFALTWGHKQIIRDTFLREDSGYTHFIYMEDDIGLGFQNFLYYVAWKNKLAEVGLIPSFLRVEYSSLQKGWVSPDNCNKIALDRHSVAFGDHIFVNPPNPHIGFFIMDREQAREHLVSNSFDMHRSEYVPFAIRERAAMGVMFDNIRQGFRSRYAIPVTRNLLPASPCLVRHLQNNYADDGAVRVPIHEMFR